MNTNQDLWQLHDTWATKRAGSLATDPAQLDNHLFEKHSLETTYPLRALRTWSVSAETAVSNIYYLLYLEVFYTINWTFNFWIEWPAKHPTENTTLNILAMTPISTYQFSMLIG